ncbi:MAG: DNA cytosine methyltransferase [Bryobacteraceae bacterium]|jgi:DNA-cytosine methyltransferase
MPWKQIFLLEDNAARATRRPLDGVSHRKSRDIVVRLHKITPEGVQLIGEERYAPGTLSEVHPRGGRIALALQLLDSASAIPKGSIVVAGPRYGSNPVFRCGVLERQFEVVVELQRGASLPSAAEDGAGRGAGSISERLSKVRWTKCQVTPPAARQPITYAIGDVMRLNLSGRKVRVFAAQIGGIRSIHQGTIIGLSSVENAALRDLAAAVSWTRWIRVVVRRIERRAAQMRSPPNARSPGLHVLARSNITTARRQDESREWGGQNGSQADSCGGLLAAEFPVLNVVELFAGAGGMGLGFLLAQRQRAHYRLIFSAEVNPIYTETLRRSFAALSSRKGGQVPELVEPADLRSRKTAERVQSISKSFGGVHVLIGGPPCQGFSNANRNSWHSTNPHNDLVTVFVRYVEKLQPLVFLMENVQGILWTPAKGSGESRPTVVKTIARRMERAGYLVFPKLLDAVWYGVPQYRSRFFLLGIHRDMGYQASDFGDWGPFPLPTNGPNTGLPYVTVRDAISDLPKMSNGQQPVEVEYNEPDCEKLRANPFLQAMRSHAAKGAVLDHVTSRHADYVIERYRQIPPGGNWRDIKAELTNYSDVERTHSNIYRRLTWDEPSITIGHYRKSMLVHPSQQRGLSLREASRLQSFPDWFRFAGSPTNGSGGLMHKQQQLANAVCPLVARAIAGRILEL